VKDFKKSLQNKTLLCDGAMGTMLQDSGLDVGQCPEFLNIENPSGITSIHRTYVDAGADIIETNTFGANRIKLGSYGLESSIAEINEAAARCALDAAGGKAFVAGSVGPSGRFLPPTGDLDFNEAVDVFSQQIDALVRAGVHLIILETFTDIKELRAAVIGAKQVTSIPIVTTMTFEPGGSSLLGSSPEAAAVTLESLGVDAVGANCGLGPDGILEMIRRMASATALPLVAQPNAGMPRLIDGKTVFPASPEDMAEFIDQLQETGAGIIGGCCGTTPEHISLMREMLRGSTVSSRLLTDPGATRLSSRQKVVFIGGNSPIRAIGERLNPTGRKTLSESIRQGNFDPYREEAARQEEAGAQILDVNVGVPGIDEAHAMTEAVLAVSQATGLPLVLDSPRPEVIEAGLKVADGKVLINSVTGEEESLSNILPLARKYGAAVIGLTLDDKGIPATAEERVAIAGKILKRARAEGIPESDIIIDCLTLSAGAQQEEAMETVRALSMLREELGLNTLLGVSNISFGLPAREYVNAAFLAMATSAGLSAAIVNPFHETSMGILAASRVILNQDIQAREFIARHTGSASGASPVDDKESISAEKALHLAVVDGQPDNARSLAEDLLAAGAIPMEIGEEILIPAMSIVGEKFASNEYFLPQVIMSARAMKAAFEPVRAALKGLDLPSRGKILLATVEGDVHDIGKNIVITLLENHGFEIIDLGKNVPADEIVLKTKNEKCHAIGLSALMTTTMVKMKEAVESIRAADLSIPVVVGGAAVTTDFADEIGADAYASDATEAVTIFLGLLENIEL